MLEIGEQVAKMLDLVIERKLKLNKLSKNRCLDNEEDEDDRKCKDKPVQVYKLDVKCCCIE